MLSAAEVLGQTGPFARLIDGFAARGAQQAMAARVADAIDGYGTLVCEAGTGTGKTFAYLVPALLSGKRVIVSTGTKNLQDQLFHRDLPVVREALGVAVAVSMLKGRANYLCLQRMQQALLEGGGSREQQAALQRVRAWSELTRSGDTSQLTDIPEDSTVWPFVTSTAENCLGGQCPLFNNCFVVKARREAQAAEVVVVNHHLYLADLALKDQGFGEVLPGADAVIFDEAHQLPEVATQFFGTSIGSRQFLDLARDSINAQVTEARDMPALRESAHRLEKGVRDLRLALGGNDRRANWKEAISDDAVRQALAQLGEIIQALRAALEIAAARGPALAICLKRCETLCSSLRTFGGEADEEAVRWFETHTRGFMLYCTPLDVARLFSERLAAHRSAWIFTSATLAVRDDFSYFTRQLGLADAVTACFESPFDYRRQALLYLPAIERDPRAAGYTEEVIDCAVPVLEASRGRAFLLFTSHRALQLAQRLLRERVGFPLFVQGEAPRAELLERFRQTPHAVLLGTSSFWEGVDVRGEALSCVIIDKLPFAAPDDPVMQARIDALRRKAGNAFAEYQLPEAVIALKQGVGRLIRDVTDRGVLVLCDPRLRGKSYGRVFLAALPPMPRTHDLSEVQSFFGL